jgi:hypothetical protein
MFYFGINRIFYTKCRLSYGRLHHTNPATENSAHLPMPLDDRPEAHRGPRRAVQLQQDLPGVLERHDRVRFLVLLVVITRLLLRRPAIAG